MLEATEDVVPPNLILVFAILEDLHEQYKQDVKLKKGKDVAQGEIMHVIAALTDPRLRGAKLSIALFARCFAEATNRGFTGHVCEATGFQSQGLVKHYATLFGDGNHSQTRIPYSEWKFEETAVFARLAVPFLVLGECTYPALGSLHEDTLFAVFFCASSSSLIRKLSTKDQL